MELMAGILYISFSFFIIYIIMGLIWCLQYNFFKNQIKEDVKENKITDYGKIIIKMSSQIDKMQKDIEELKNKTEL